MTAAPGTTPTGEVLPSRVRWLAWLVLGQGVAMLLYAAATVVVALAEASTTWGAVAFVLVTLSLWGVGLVFVSRRGLLGARRWAFSPVMFTEAMFGIIAVADVRAITAGAARTTGDWVAVAVWLLVLASALGGLVLLFSPEVRHTLVPPPAAPR